MARPLIWLVSPAHGRFVVTELALTQRARLAGELARRGLEMRCVVVADDENLDTARGFGFDAFEHPNLPLGRKLNAGIEHACRAGADYVVYVDSDQWVHPDFFDVLPRDEAPAEPPTPDYPVVVWHRAPELVVGAEIALVNLPRARLTRCRARGRYGVVPWTAPRALLEPSGYRPVMEGLNRGIDGSFVRGLRVRPVVVVHDPHPLARVDFKTEENLTAYEWLVGDLGVAPEEDLSALAELWPDDLVEGALALRR